jgi:glycosyltransferase involved in cell wall biosynthesis
VLLRAETNRQASLRPFPSRAPRPVPRGDRNQSWMMGYMQNDEDACLTSSSVMSVVHWGSFSGTVAMLRKALDTIVDAEFHDVARVLRRPELLPSRMAAQLESRLSGTPWYKSVVWSRALERWTLRQGWITAEKPTLFLQTLPAFDLPARLPYFIYTDRVAREGAQGPPRFRSRWGPGWLERETQFLRKARHVFVMGPSTKRTLVEMYGLPEGAVTVVGAGPGSPVGEVARRVSLRRLLFIGTNWALKGGPEALRAFERLSDRHPGLTLTIAGSDPSGPVPSRVEALGRVSRAQMTTLFSTADAFIAPAHMEALGYSLLEALLHGMPAIGSNIGNQEWLIGDAGLTVPPGDVAATEAAIETLIANFDTYSERAFDRAYQLRRSMTWTNVAEAITRQVGLGAVR